MCVLIESPQSLAKSTAAHNILNGCDFNANSEVSRSPSMYSVCSDGGIECTPPHKKSTMRLDDVGDGDYSPKVFDNSFSPSCFLSQTMAVDSPEVGWKWKRHTASIGVGGESTTRTPDSAYAADSSFTSAGSSSTEMMTNARARSDNYNKRIAKDARKEQELRRFEKTRADEKLKQRCAKLQEQLKSAGEQKPLISQSDCSEKTLTCNASATPIDYEFITPTTTTTTLKLESPLSTNHKSVAALACEDSLNDFFNDSDADCFLLAVTQEIESKIDLKPQTTTRTSPQCITTNTKAEEKSKPNASNSNSNSTSSSTTNSSSPSTSSNTCTPLTKEKRSSFYMKFLEDDCTDDWFISLDDVILQATQPKKPRTSLQRYKSMPTKGNDDKVAATTAVAKSDPMLNDSTDSFVESPALSSGSRSKIKRHSSSHALSPASANCKYLK